jgi:hypothetical protein
MARVLLEECRLQPLDLREIKGFRGSDAIFGREMTVIQEVEIMVDIRAGDKLIHDAIHCGTARLKLPESELGGHPNHALAF